MLTGLVLTAGILEATVISTATVDSLDWSQNVFGALVESRRRQAPVLVYVFDKT